MMTMARGTVLWFSNDKGYGFIRTSEGLEVFVHFSSIQKEGFRGLKTGDIVEFELKAGPKGQLAQNVRKIG
jgi:CspA family cold shock protein